MAFESPEMETGGAPRPLSEINMIPLIDVMLVLLVVFIVTAPLLKHSVRVSLPKADTKTTAVPKAVVVGLDRELQLFIENAPTTREDLKRRLKMRIERGDTPAVELHADGEIAYREIVSLMALLQNVGITKLSFMTEPDRNDTNRSD
jgi:biopolymer transport protein ExbD